MQQKPGFLSLLRSAICDGLSEIRTDLFSALFKTNPGASLLSPVLCNTSSGFFRSPSPVFCSARMTEPRTSTPVPIKKQESGTKVCLGKKMLVPLTASLYVTGTLDDTDRVLVDTGYFIEKTMAAGKDYCNRKMKLLKSNNDELVQGLTSSGYLLAIGEDKKPYELHPDGNR